jgi:hypothetical protein
MLKVLKAKYSRRMAAGAEQAGTDARKIDGT